MTASLELNMESKALTNVAPNPAVALTAVNEALRDEIRHRTLAEAKLRESEARYRTLVEHAPEAIVVLDVDAGTFVDVNQNACRFFGMACEELLRYGPVDLSPPTQPSGASSSEIGRKYIEEALAGRTPRFEWIHRNAAGMEVPCEVFLVRLPSVNRRLVRGSILDISERKRAERRERNRRDVLEQVAKGRELRAMLDAIVALVEQEAFGSLCSILLMDKSGRHLLHGSAPHLPEFYNRAVHGLEIGPRVGSCGTAAYLKKRIVVEDIQSDSLWEPYRELASQAGLAACWSEPIVSSMGQILGTFAIYHSTPQAPTAEELEAISVAAHLASIAIERANAEEALRESEERLRLAQQAARIGSFEFNVQTGNYHCTPEHEALHGLQPGGCPRTREGWEALIHPDDRAEAIRQTRRAYETGQTTTGEWRVVWPDGAIHWIAAHFQAFRDEVGQPMRLRGVSQDITERKQAEAAVLASQAMLQMVLDNIPQGVFWKNRDSVYLGCNRVVARAFGLQDAKQIVGRTDRDLSSLTLEQAEFFVQKDREVMVDDAPRLGIIEQATLPDGSNIWMETNKVPMHDPEGAVIGILGTWQDITERKRDEEERRRLEAQVQHAQKLESLGVMAGGIAHDFNNLLTSILGYADLALMELPADSSARGLIAEAVNGARRAAELTKQMLAYSGKGRFKVEAVNLSRLTEEMARLLQMSISKKCVVNYHFMPNLPAIRADASQMRQIIMNLVINASEAIGDQSGVISVTTGAMHCDRTILSETYLDADLPEGHYVFLEVSDNGCGMSAETKAKIFDPFFTTKFTGRGLGLSSVLGIVRSHRGAIKVYSEPGLGTSVKVLFPATDLPAARVEPKVYSDPAWRGSGTVLIVDDEESVRTLAARMLRTMGFDALTAADGREAVTIFRERADQIALVLLDMTMPHLDGAETLREIKAIRSDVPAILSSGYSEQAALGRTSGSKAAFIQKPYQYEELRRVVRRVIEHPGEGSGY